MKTILNLAAATAAALAAFVAGGADLTVAQGDSPVTLADGDSYGAIIVNGSLTIPANAAVTAASLVVATNITGNAYVTLEPGSSLTLSGEIHLGYDGGQAHLDVKSGASLTVGGDFFMAYGHTSTPASNADPTRAFLTVSNATVTVGGSNGLYFYHSKYWPGGASQTATSVDTVRLEEGGLLDCKQIRKGGESGSKQFERSSTIVFAGGCINSGKIWREPVVIMTGNAAKTYIYLVSEDGNPISLKANSKCLRWFSFSTKSARVRISGDGDLVLESTDSDYTWASADQYWDENNPNVSFASGGRIRIVGGTIGAYGTNAFSTVGDNCLRSLVLEKGATFDMKGVDAEFASVFGTLSNSGAPCTLAVGGDGSDPVYPQVLPPGVTLVKKGAGDMSLFAGAADAISAEAGTLSLMGRAEIGYPFYKFNLYGTVGTGTKDHQLKISEFHFLDGAANVTAGWADYHYSHAGTSTYSEPTNMWDGVLTTEFYDQRDQYWTTVSNIHATLEYRPSRRVTGYTWWTGNFWDHRKHSFPTNWAVFGSSDNLAWERLDLVDGFALDNPDVRAWCGTNFVCRYEPTVATIGSLTMADGTALTADGADITVSSVSAASAIPVSLAHGASLTLPAATEIASLAVDVDSGGGTLANFRPTHGGVVYLTGTVANPRNCVLPVQVGTLLGEDLSSWRVNVNGVPEKDVGVIVSNGGYLETKSIAATVIYMR